MQIYYVVSSVLGQVAANLVFCLVTGAGKTVPSCPFWTAPLVTRRIARNLLDGVGDAVAKSGKRTLLTIINALVFS